MKKFKKVLLIGLGLFIMTGCGNENKDATVESVTDNEPVAAESSEKVESKIEVEITEDGKEITTKTIDIKKDELLGTIMKDNFDVKDDKGMIISIEGKESDDKAQRYWMYEVNGEQPTVGADDYKVQPGDNIVWNLGN